MMRVIQQRVRRGNFEKIIRGHDASFRLCTEHFATEKWYREWRLKFNDAQIQRLPAADLT
jgi:hypothetical protein